MSGARAFERPANPAEILAEVVESARRAPFWRRRLGDRPIRSLSDFESLPTTPASEYRRQRFGDVLADSSGVGWIPGPLLGQSPDRVAVAEGADEAQVRIRAITRALSRAVPPGVERPTALVASTAAGRYFGAEMCAALIRRGIPAHLVTDEGSDDLAGLVRRLEPDILGILTPALDVENLPRSVVGAIGLIGSPPPRGVARHVAILAQNELGALGFAINGGGAVLNEDLFHFETSPSGTLIATPYYSRVQPIVRLDTGVGVSG